MIVAIIAVARVSVLQTWVGHLRRGQFIAGVSRQHERVDKVIVEVLRQLELAVPGIQRHHCLVEFLLHGWQIVRDFKHQVGAFVVDSISEVHAGRALSNSVLLQSAIVLKIKAHVSQGPVANYTLVVVAGASDQELGATVESVRFDVALACLFAGLGELVEELPLHDLGVVLLAEHRSQAEHVLLEVGEVGAALVLRVDPAHLHVERDRSDRIVIQVQLQVSVDELDGDFGRPRLKPHLLRLAIAQNHIILPKHVRNGAACAEQELLKLALFGFVIVHSHSNVGWEPITELCGSVITVMHWKGHIGS